MKTWIVSALAVLLVGSTQISCNVNDYCLNCETGGDGGHGSGVDDAGIDGNGSDMPDAGCVVTGPEECDGKDNNCNGFIDEGNNLPGVGDPCTNQNGACAGGQLQCINGALKCDKVPAPETCNGVDDNCSGGQPDEGDPGGGGKCGTDEGACTAGQFHCDPTTGMVKCFGFDDHRLDTEACNKVDDNCDGLIDNNVPSAGPCGPVAIGNVGRCKVGHLECKPGGVTTCDDAVFPAFETCNTMDDDCDGDTDEIFDLKHDIKNCGACNNVCPTGMNANATCNPPAGNPSGNGQCGLSCKPGYKDLDGQPGCEFGPCFATGDEVCDGDDNDCDGKTDENVVPPAICKSGGECGAVAPTAVCDNANGWKCTYTGAVQFPETLCDGKDNNCDGNIDENQPNKGQTCHEDSETTCNETSPTTLAIGDNDGDGKVNDGCVRVGGAAESGTDCNDLVDNDNDGFVNDGCPAVARQGACRGSGTYKCDDRAGSDPNGPAICNITSAGIPQPATFETCDAADNDCDGNVDEGANTGNLAGQEWVDIGNNRQMQKYEASRADAKSDAFGSSSTTVCSRSGVQPWINVKYPDAVAACASIGATLCTEQEWHYTCGSIGVTSPDTTHSYSGTGLYIDAENYGPPSNIFAANVAETACGSDQVDNDNDGNINDGCPVVSGTAETKCHDGVDDDGDNAINDGCPATGNSWVSDYTTGFTGISDMEVTPNLGVSVASNNLSQAARLTYNVNVAAGTPAYHVWIKLYSNNGADDMVYATVGSGSVVTIITTINNAWRWYDLGSYSATGTVNINVYQGEDGVKFDRLYIGNAAAPGTNEPASSAGGKWAFSSPKDPNTYETDICNGHDYRTVNITNATRADTGVVTINATHPFVVGDLVQIQGAGDTSLNGVYTVTTVTGTTSFTYTQTTTTPISTAVAGGTATEAKDPLLTTGFLGQNCSSTLNYTVPVGQPAKAANHVYDMSGNVREWTLAHTPGENPIKGGASNGTAQGISCALNFTLGDDSFFFPNVGFRCCRTKP